MEILQSFNQFWAGSLWQKIMVEASPFKRDWRLYNNLNVFEVINGLY